MTETWRKIDGWPGYEVSDLGAVRSTNGRWSNGGVTLRKTYTDMHKGRPKCVTVILTKGKKKKALRVHRLVLMAFKGLPPPGMIGCHRDGDPTNNKLHNLRWDTHSSNTQDAIRHGTYVPPGARLKRALIAIRELIDADSEPDTLDRIRDILKWGLN